MGPEQARRDAQQAESKMKRRDATLISRIFILSMVALALSIGATIVLESEELTKIVPRTKLREFLIFFAPLVSIMLV
jgi:hypothetical protein